MSHHTSLPPPDPKAALQARYHDLELKLIDAATAALAGSSLPAGTPPVSAETALKLLALRGASLPGAEAEVTVDPGQLRQRLGARVAAIRRAGPIQALPQPTVANPER